MIDDLSLPGVLAFLFKAFVVIVALSMFLRTFVAIRTKGRVKWALQQKVVEDAQFREFMRQSKTKPIEEQDIAAIRAKIDEAVVSLNSTDRKIVHEGLDPTHPKGAERFFADISSAA